MTIEDTFLRAVQQQKFIQTRAGIKIGCAYTPPARPASDDAERIQSALLDPLTARPLPLVTRLYRRIAHWL